MIVTIVPPTLNAVEHRGNASTPLAATLRVTSRSSM